MINTKDIEVTIGPSTYKVSVDYEQDGSIVAVVIAGDIRDLLSWANYNNVVDAFNEAMEE